jgi:hypothetical protein
MCPYLLCFALLYSIQCKLGVYQSATYAVGTFAMLLFTASLAMLSRVYVLRLLRTSGCDMDEMDKFLLDDEVSDLEDATQLRRISYKELKSAMERIKSSEKIKHTQLSSHSPKKDGKPMELSRGATLWNKTKGIKMALRMKNAHSANNPSPYVATDAGTAGGVLQASSCKVRGLHSPMASAVNSTTNSSRGSTRGSLRGSVRGSVRRVSRKESVDHRLRREQLLGAGIKSGIFFFDSPYIYFQLRDIRLLYLYVLDPYAVQCITRMQSIYSKFI